VGTKELKLLTGKTSHTNAGLLSALDARLPNAVHNVRFHRHQYGGQFGDLDYYSLYLKFQASRAEYREFMRRLNIAMKVITWRFSGPISGKWAVQRRFSPPFP